MCIGGLPSNAKQNAISYTHNHLVNEVYIAICDCCVMVWYVMEINTRSSDLVVYFTCVTFAYKASLSLTQRYKEAKSPRGWKIFCRFCHICDLTGKTFCIWHMNGVLYMTLHLSKHDGMLSNKHGRAKTQGLMSGLRIVLKLPTLDDTTYAIT